ncbi:hypothetical protein M9Y10_036453 [Tritrichomonas musculus]|uniref:HAT C-terminal dimerisation domain-containing protein n=1 Tax=Tritrichomonas musculus TaxID=1915356 RepID=A0ABR2GUV8_9EUKA
MKIIPAKISLLKKKDLEKLQIGFYPPLQSQRWNSIYITLRYITMNIGAISHLFTQEQIQYLQLIDLLQLQKELQPIYDFTTICESDDATQSTVFIQYRALEAQLQMIGTPRAEKILELLNKRFTKTADIDISKLCYFITKRCLAEKHNFYPHVEKNDILDPNDANAIMYDKELSFINSFKSTIEKICHIISYDSEAIWSFFKLMMMYYHPSDCDILKYPGEDELLYFSNNYAGGNRFYIIFSKFINILQILPSSESGSERVFARMRDSHSEKQTRQSAKSLRSNIIVNFYADEIQDS